MPDENKLNESTEKSLEQSINEQSGNEAQEESGVDDVVPSDELNKKRQELQNGQSEADEPVETQDAGDEPDKYDQMLKNTWGFDEDDISPKARKLAKSFVSIQKKATKNQQKAKESQELAGKFNNLLENNPELKQHAQQILQGGQKQQENPSQRKPSNGQSNKQGQLDEQELISQGYLDQNDLAGLDDLARENRVLRAQMKYEKDNTLNDFRQSLQNEQEQLRKKNELKNVKKVNKQRLGKSFDRFVQDTGFDLVNLDEDIFNEIQQNAVHDRDPSDPRKVKEDAFETSAMRVLRKHDRLDNSNVNRPTQRNGVNLEDTGKSVSNSQQQTSNKSIEERLEERENQDFQNTAYDPKQKYIQQ